MKKISDNDKRMVVGNQITKYKFIYMLVIGLVAIFELALIIRAIFVFSFSSIRHYLYFFSYVFLFVSSAFVSTVIHITGKKKAPLDTYRMLSHIYTCAIVIWSMTISYLDMKVAHTPIVYLTVMTTIAGIVVLEPEFFLTVLAISSLSLVGLDSIGGFKYFISTSEYINYFVFICMAGIIGVRHFFVSYKEYKSQENLENSVLEERNRVSQISLQTILSINNTVDAKDKYTSEHSKRVAEYSKEIANRLNWEKSRIEELYQIGLLHDIGKIGVPDSILNCTEKLTNEEYEQMKQHTVIGGEILKDLTILKNVDLGAKYHHERYDGNGYPSGLKGEEIPIEARIIAVADAFDAMNSNRVYRKRLTSETIMNELLEQKGKQFDPSIIDAFMPYAEEVLKNRD